MNTNASRRVSRYLDPFRLNDYIVKWCGTKVADRQDLGRRLLGSRSLYTRYAARKIGKQERFAREQDLTVIPQGADTYVVLHKIRGGTPGNRIRGRQPAWREERDTVNVKDKTCTCAFQKANRACYTRGGPSGPPCYSRRPTSISY